MQCSFEVNSVVVELDGWTDVIDQAHWRFLDPRTDLPVGFFEKSGTKIEFVGAITGVGSRGCYIDG